MTRNEYGDAFALLISKFQVLETKVDALSNDRATRSDIEKLRAELIGSFVSQNEYRPKHDALIERTTQLDMQLREMRKDHDTDIKEVKEAIKAQHEIQLSGKERFWVRFSQIVGFASLVLFLLEYLTQHVKLQ